MQDPDAPSHSCWFLTVRNQLVRQGENLPQTGSAEHGSVRHAPTAALAGISLAFPLCCFVVRKCKLSHKCTRAAVWVILLVFIIAVKVSRFLKMPFALTRKYLCCCAGSFLCAACFHQIKCLNHPSGKCEEKPSNKRGRHLC